MHEMTTRRFESRTVLVTGACAGIGRAITSRFAAEGARIIAIDRDEAKGQALVAELNAAGTPAVFFSANVAESASVTRAIEAGVEHFGGLDVAVNNAGIAGGPLLPVTDMTDDQWHVTLNVNLNGVFYCVRAEMRAMRDNGGAIVNIASMMGQIAMANIAAYVTSKHGVVGLTKVAALDGGPQNIRVNAVAPTFIRTALMDGVPDDVWQTLRAQQPLARFPTAEEVAGLVAYLCSDEARNITGSTHFIDGGFSVH